MGELYNREIINDIAGAMLIPTQVGGGIRKLDTIEQLLHAGVERIILGTAAVEDAELVAAACRRYREFMVIGIDAREGNLAVRAWREQTTLAAVEFARSMVQLGARRFIYTDISRDGTLTEPNFAAIFDMVNAIKCPVIAAGGISSLNHLKMLQKLGVEGAIIGKALYTGDIKLKQALDLEN